MLDAYKTADNLKMNEFQAANLKNMLSMIQIRDKNEDYKDVIAAINK
jgi:hypothetical protein